MNHFSVKSIGLYSLAIGGSIAFFDLVTSYGEAHLKAPPAVTGVYAIAAGNLPGCLQNRHLSIDLQQSGMYLNASLVANSNTVSPATTRPTLSGELRAPQLYLRGLVSTKICPQLSRISISGTISDRRLQGQISLAEERLEPKQHSKSIDFSATRQASGAPATPATPTTGSTPAH